MKKLLVVACSVGAFALVGCGPGLTPQRPIRGVFAAVDPVGDQYRLFSGVSTPDPSFDITNWAVYYEANQVTVDVVTVNPILNASGVVAVSAAVQIETTGDDDFDFDFWDRSTFYYGAIQHKVRFSAGASGDSRCLHDIQYSGYLIRFTFDPLACTGGTGPMRFYVSTTPEHPDIFGAFMDSAPNGEFGQPGPWSPWIGPPPVYKNCTDVRGDGAAPIHRGDPGYTADLDRDGDGIACE